MLKIAFSKIYNHSLPEGHRFPMLKYDLIAEQLLYEGTASKENFFEPDILSEEIITLTHSKEYWIKLKTLNLSKMEERRSGFPLSHNLVKRERIIMNGTVLATEYATKYGVAFNIAGGTHHAYSNKAEGFCLLNDNAIAANYLLHNNLAGKVLIIDLDVHQGNGTAEIFKNNPNVFTYSMHCVKNLFSNKEKSNLDIELESGIEDKEYLNRLHASLPGVIRSFKPDFVFYQSGVDVLSTDKLGQLRLSRQGCLERDRQVFELCKNHKLPVVVDMGGGYSPRISDIVEAHCNTFRVATQIFF